MGAGRRGRPAVHHHQRLRHPDGGAEGEVPGDFQITKNLTAVKNQCFLSLSYDEVTPSPAELLRPSSNRHVAPPVRVRFARRRFVTTNPPPLSGAAGASSLARTLDQVSELVST